MEKGSRNQYVVYHTHPVYVVTAEPFHAVGREIEGVAHYTRVNFVSLGIDGASHVDRFTPIALLFVPMRHVEIHAAVAAFRC